MYQTADGKKKFGSSFVGKRYDEAHAEPKSDKDAEPSTEKDAKKKFGNVLSDKADELNKEVDDSDSQEEEQEHPVVAEHGKAHKVIVSHDEAAGKHHVMSHHPDGHMNESDHATGEEAHDEGKKLSGFAAPKEDVADPDTDSQNTSGSESDGFDMPSL